jgi:hypothetical protein
MNKRFIKSAVILSIIKIYDPTAYIKRHIKKLNYESSSACTCCENLVVNQSGYILYTNLKNRELKKLNIKTNSPLDYWGYY